MGLRLASLGLSVAGLALLAGCSGSSSSGTGTGLPGGTAAQADSRSMRTGDPTGVEPRFLQGLRFGHGAPATKCTTCKGAPKELAITDFASSSTYLLNNKYEIVDTLTGFSGPDGDWVDGSGNLYVADYAAVSVDEFAPGGSSPTATYTSGLTDPIGVSTDKKGNVYVADYGDGAASVVEEFPQGSNTPSVSCSTGLSNESIVVDAKGDVFVDGNNSSLGVGQIIEYSKGLTGCNGTTLTPTLGFAGGMQLDNKGDIVVCDQDTGVDIIPPPYTSISSTITGAGDPFHIALTKSNALIYIADLSNFDVLVDDYPSGANVTTLSGNGLEQPAGVATYPFARK